MVNNNGDLICLYSIWSPSGKSSVCGELAKFNYRTNSSIREIPVCGKHMGMILAEQERRRTSGAVDGGEGAPLEALSTPLPDSGLKAGTTPPTSK